MSIDKSLPAELKLRANQSLSFKFSNDLRTVSGPPAKTDDKAGEPISPDPRVAALRTRIDNASITVRKRAKGTSIHSCAEYVRTALERSGFDIENTRFARDYGPKLEAAGFAPVAVFDKNKPDNEGDFPKGYTPQKGDVAVIQPCPGHPIGHMVMFDGTQWISDFKQRTMYPGDGYRKHKPPYTIYRAQVPPEMIASK